MNKPIQAFQVSFSKNEIADFLARAETIVTTGALIPGVNNQELEKAFAAFTDMKYAAAVASGTIALEVIYRCLELADYEVLVPANTNYATVEAVLRAGAKPILYDSDLYPDFLSIQALVTPQTKALVVVHIGGYVTPEIEQIEHFCKEHDLYLIEDASHAHGSRYRSRKAGTFGIASAFSMFATKVLTTSEGGIIVTNEETLQISSKIYRDQGKDKEGIRNIVAGSSWRMSELHAALGLAQMPHAQEYVDRNNAIAHRYKRDIVETDVLTVPLEDDGFYSGYKCVVTVSSAAAAASLKTYLLEHDIKPGKNVYDVPIHQQPTLSFLGTGSYPKAELFASTHVCLPIWKGLTDEEITYIVECVNKWGKT